MRTGRIGTKKSRRRLDKEIVFTTTATRTSLDALGPVLDIAVLKAIHVDERARTETDINDGARSVGSAAVALAEDRRDTGTALVIGAGEMGSLVANGFADSSIETLCIANRSVPTAERLADDVDLAEVRAVGLDALSSVLAEADVVVSATGSDDSILGADDLDGCGTTLVIDTARPRDVSPAVDPLDGVTVLDLDALESVVDDSRRRRRDAVASVEAIVDREFGRLRERCERERAEAVIAAMYQRAAEIRSCEVSKAVSRLEAQGDDADARREVVASSADALVSRLLATSFDRVLDGEFGQPYTNDYVLDEAVTLTRRRTNEVTAATTTAD